MNKNKLFLLFIFVTSIRCYAQESYKLADFELESPGAIYLTDTDSVAGTIRYNELTSGGVTLIDPSGRTKRYNAKEIIGFKTQKPAKTFSSVKSDGLDKSMMLYEDITPAGGKKLKLLKGFLQDGIIITGGQVKGKWDSQMYDNSTKKLLGSNFKKVAEALKNCPAVADKITKKEKGYYFGMMSTPMQQDQVLTNIVTEYNACQ